MVGGMEASEVIEIGVRTGWKERKEGNVDRQRLQGRDEGADYT